jgi:hypothetical protein
MQTQGGDFDFVSAPILPSGGESSLVVQFKPASTLLLGGAAVHRCDKRPLFTTGFSRRGKAFSMLPLSSKRHDGRHHLML